MCASNALFTQRRSSPPLTIFTVYHASHGRPAWPRRRSLEPPFVSSPPGFRDFASRAESGSRVIGGGGR